MTRWAVTTAQAKTIKLAGLIDKTCNRIAIPSSGAFNASKRSGGLRFRKAESTLWKPSAEWVSMPLDLPATRETGLVVETVAARGLNSRPL